MQSGPIILIDDDEDDHDMFQYILRELGVSNEVIWFKECEAAFSFLKETRQQPFVIFCDQNLPGLSGVECKFQIDNDPELRKKSIPFIFFSTSIDQRIVNEAYTKMTVQGYFQKKSSYADLKETIRLIIAYWAECRHPNSK